MVKIAYCLLVHKNPRQVSRLLRSIYSESDLFWVNVFEGRPSREEWLREIAEIGAHNIIVRFNYGKSWGTFPVVSATLDAMRGLAKSDYDYFINLTGQCYPLKSNIAIKHFLHGRNTTFMEKFKLPYPAIFGGNGGLDRIRFSYYKHPILDFRTKLLNSISGQERFENRRFIRLPKFSTVLPYGLEPYAGSMFFCFAKKHVDFVLAYLRDKPKIIKFFMHSYAPDELFFQTILCNSQLKEEVVHNNLRYIDWSRSGVARASPAVLTAEDAENMLHSSKLYARKFDPERDSSILDLIDRHREGK